MRTVNWFHFWRIKDHIFFGKYWYGIESYAKKSFFIWILLQKWYYRARCLFVQKATLEIPNLGKITVCSYALSCLEKLKNGAIINSIFVTIFFSLECHQEIWLRSIRNNCRKGSCTERDLFWSFFSGDRKKSIDQYFWGLNPFQKKWY